MQIEYLRGPLDGATAMVPIGTKIWIVHTQPSARDVMRMSEADIPVAEVQSTEHAYAVTGRSAASGARIFEYVGERVKP